MGNCLHSTNEKVSTPLKSILDHDSMLHRYVLASPYRSRVGEGNNGHLFEATDKKNSCHQVAIKKIPLLKNNKD